MATAARTDRRARSPVTAAPAPLAGSLIVSIGHTLPGLYCLALLRDLGAEVLRIERRQHGAAGDPYAALADDFPVRSLTAGTRALQVDLKYAQGLFRYGEVQLYVSSGTGVIGLPIRMGVRPEITVLRLMRDRRG